VCGFAGFRGSFPMGWLSSAGDLIAHRGPDDCGMWVAPDGSAGLVHRRLSIIDLTAAGHQPMVDPETGVVIAYNGEIYNYRELRAELQARGGIFRSASDTEVLVQGLVRRVSGETNPDYLARPCSSGCGSRSTSCGFRAAIALFLYHYLVLGAWRAGWVGYAWSRLRTDVYRLWEYKLREIRLTGQLPMKPPAGPGESDPRVPHYD